MDLGKRHRQTHAHILAQRHLREKSSMSKAWHRKRSLCPCVLVWLWLNWKEVGQRCPRKDRPKITSFNWRENGAKLLRFSSNQTAASEREKSYARLFMCMCVRVRVVYAFRRKKNYSKRRKCKKPTRTAAAAAAAAAATYWFFNFSSFFCLGAHVYMLKCIYTRFSMRPM